MADPDPDPTFCTDAYPDPNLHVTLLVYLAHGQVIVSQGYTDDHLLSIENYSVAVVMGYCYTDDHLLSIENYSVAVVMGYCYTDDHLLSIET